MKEHEALQLITKTFGEKPENIRPDTLRDNIPNWDSIGSISLMAELDEQFGIMLEENELDSMRRIDDILEVLRKHGKLLN
jgi:acyl carrier protein